MVHFILLFLLFAAPAAEAALSLSKPDSSILGLKARSRESVCRVVASSFKQPVNLKKEKLEKIKQKMAVAKQCFRLSPELIRENLLRGEIHKRGRRWLLDAFFYQNTENTVQSLEELQEKLRILAGDLVSEQEEGGSLKNTQLWVEPLFILPLSFFNQKYRVDYLTFLRQLNFFRIHPHFIFLSKELFKFRFDTPAFILMRVFIKKNSYLQAIADLTLTRGSPLGGSDKTRPGIELSRAQILSLIQAPGSFCYRHTPLDSEALEGGILFENKLFLEDLYSFGSDPQDELYCEEE